MCFGNKNAETTLQLWDSTGSMVAETYITGNNAEYSFGNISLGVYTLLVNKQNHTTREYTVTLGSGAITQSVELHLVGDITGDETINARDKKMLFNHIAGTAILEDYDFAVADVTGDNMLNARDKKMIYNHIAGTSSLWE